MTVYSWKKLALDWDEAVKIAELEETEITPAQFLGYVDIYEGLEEQNNSSDDSFGEREDMKIPEYENMNRMMDGAINQHELDGIERERHTIKSRKEITPRGEKQMNPKKEAKIESKGNHNEDEPDPSWGLPSKKSTPRDDTLQYNNQINNKNIIPPESKRENPPHKQTASLDWQIAANNGALPSEEKQLIGFSDSNANRNSTNFKDMQVTTRDDGTSRPSGIDPAENNSKGFQFMKFETSKGFNGYDPGYNPGNGNGGFADSKGFQLGSLQDSKGFGQGFKDSDAKQYTGLQGTPPDHSIGPINNGGEVGRRADHKSFSKTGANILQSHILDNGKDDNGPV